MGSKGLVWKLVLLETGPPLLISLMGATLLLLIGRIIPLTEFLVRSGARAGEILRLTALLLPSFLLFSLPVAVLLGILIAFLRLSRDAETVALLSCGMRPERLLGPVLLVSGIGSLLALAAAAVVTPHAKHAARGLLRDLAEKRLVRGVAPGRFVKPAPGLTLYVHETKRSGRKLKGVYLRDGRSGGAVEIFSQGGSLKKVPDGIVLVLRDGVISESSPSAETASLLSFEEYRLRLALAEKARRPRRGEMSITSLFKAARSKDISRRRRLKLLSEAYKRIAFPLGVLVLGLFAFPAGVLLGRGGGVALGISAGILAFVGYYLLAALSANLAETGALPPGPSLFIPDLVFGSAAFLLVRRLMQSGIRR